MRMFVHPLGCKPMRSWVIQPSPSPYYIRWQAFLLSVEVDKRQKQRDV